MARKIAIYTQEIVDRGEISTQYSLEPREASDQEYMDTGLICQRRRESRIAGYFTPAENVKCEVADNNDGEPMLFVDGQGYGVSEVINGLPAMSGMGHYETDES